MIPADERLDAAVASRLLASDAVRALMAEAVERERGDWIAKVDEFARAVDLATFPNPPDVPLQPHNGYVRADTVRYELARILTADHVGVES